MSWGETREVASVTVYEAKPDGTSAPREYTYVSAVVLVRDARCLLIDFQDGDQVYYPLERLWGWEVTAA